MFSWLKKIALSFWRRIKKYSGMSNDDEELGGADDPLLWYRDLEKHCFGEFSFAIVQGNEVLEDHSQVESVSETETTFVGVYDGHAGPEAARFICDHLFRHLIRLAQDNGTISEDVLRSAISATEDGFLSLVRRTYGTEPLIAAVGSCCLVGVIWKGTLYVANLGDSRAVLGYLDTSNKIVAEQLTRDHNVSFEEVRQELRLSHPDDSQIVVMRNGAWRIKGIIQVSKAIGDAYLKKPELSIGPSYPRFHLPEPLSQPVLSAEPDIHSRVLEPNDNFIIFASDGLWEHMTSQEAVEVVYNNPRRGIARRLLKSVLTVAARKRGKRYDELKKIEKQTRRSFHDDITVVVVFIDYHLLGEKISVPELSVRGFSETGGSSNVQHSARD